MCPLFSFDQIIFYIDFVVSAAVNRANQELQYGSKKLQCGSWDYSVDPEIAVWVLAFRCGSIDNGVNLGITTWILRLQFGFWMSSMDSGILVEILGL